jgi:hypothetical protein
MSEAPVQLLKVMSVENLSAALDDLNDKYIAFAVFYGLSGYLPTEADTFAEGCLLVHKAERKLYINQAADGAVANFIAVDVQ